MMLRARLGSGAAAAGPAAGRFGAWLRRSAATGAIAAATAPTAAFAQSEPNALQAIAIRFSAQEAAGAAVLGIAIFAVTTALFYMRERSRWTARERELVGQLAQSRARADIADLMVRSEQQAIVTWSGRDAAPVIESDLPLPLEGASLLAFGTWLPPAEARRIEAALEQLKARGEAFRLTLRPAGGTFIEAEGRPVGGQAVLRLREVSGAWLEVARASTELDDTRIHLTGLRQIMEQSGHMVWTRDRTGRIDWCNAAYAKAVDVGGPLDVLARQSELLDRGDRDAAARARVSGQPFQCRTPAVVAGARRVVDVREVATDHGWAGIAVDVTEVEDVRADLERQTASHARTLDALQTAVAIFDGNQRLIFHNAAYRTLWDLDETFLDGRPTDGEILDRLRGERKIPEQADYRGWKTGFLGAYRALEAREDWWYLPDGRMLRVVVNPNPRGGVTYLYEDVTERVDLESRFNALNRVQRETLDTLNEGVAVFGTDGRLKLINRALGRMWRLPESLTEIGASGSGAHVDDIAAACAPLVLSRTDAWDEIRRAVAGLREKREPIGFRLARRDGMVLDAGVAPLPDGATLVTFSDVTASVNVERALTERNEALERASRLRDDFVHHVSYELRSPLTTIIGFAQLLGDEVVGALNDKQREYAGHITQSSAALLAIINDILDLATIDNGAIELNRESIDIHETIAAAVRGVEDRLAEASLKLVLDVPASIGSFQADAKRVRQILFNLLSNAIGFSAAGQTIRIAARRGGGEVSLTVTDEGRGIPDEVRTRVFERFESHTAGSRHRGAGLGLSIVKSLVELHGGRVALDSAPAKGTSVTCVFPDSDAPVKAAAE